MGLLKILFISNLTEQLQGKKYIRRTLFLTTAKLVIFFIVQELEREKYAL